jgi:WD40 repeat protein
MDTRGERYARGRGDGAISVRRIAEDRELWNFAGRGGSIDWVLRFSPEGRFLAATDYHPQERHLRAWNLQTGALVLDTPLAVQKAALDFQPHSAVIAAADAEGSVYWFDLETGKRWVWERKVKSPYVLRFRPDGGQIAVSCATVPGIGIYEAHSGNLISELEHAARVYVLDWSPDGHWLAAPSADKNLYVWDVSGMPQLSRTLKGHDEAVTWAVFHPSGDLLVSGSWDDTIALWSPSTGHRWCQWAGSAQQASLSTDGRWLGLIGSGASVRVLELNAGGGFKWLATGPSRPDGAGDFSPDGRWVATGTESGFVIWDAASGQPMAQRQAGQVRWISFCGRRSSIFTGGDSEISEWPMTIGATGVVQLGPARPLAIPTPCTTCSSSDDGQIVAAAARGGVWVQDQRRSVTFRLAEWPICNEVAISPDGRWVAAHKWGTTDIHIWELPSQKEKILSLNYPDFEFTPDGRFFVSRTDGALCCWEVGTWRQGHARPHDGYGNQGRLAFSLDGRWAAVEEPGDAVKVLSMPTMTPVVTLRSVPGFPVSLSPDGTRLLVQTAKGIFGVWDLRRINQELTAMRLGWDERPGQSGDR